MARPKKKNLMSLLPITTTILIQAKCHLDLKCLVLCFSSCQSTPTVHTAVSVVLINIQSDHDSSSSPFNSCSSLQSCFTLPPTLPQPLWAPCLQHTNTSTFNTTQSSTIFNTPTFNTTFNIPIYQPKHNMTFNNFQHANTPTFNTTQPSTTFNTPTQQPSTQPSTYQHTNLQHNTTFNNLQHTNTPTLNTMQPSTQPSTQPSAA